MENHGLYTFRIEKLQKDIEDREEIIRINFSLLEKKEEEAERFKYMAEKNKKKADKFKRNAQELYNKKNELSEKVFAKDKEIERVQKEFQDMSERSLPWQEAILMEKDREIYRLMSELKESKDFNLGVQDRNRGYIEIDNGLLAKDREISEIRSELFRKNMQILELQKNYKEQEGNTKRLKKELLDMKEQYESCLQLKETTLNKLRDEIAKLKEREIDSQGAIFQVIKITNDLATRDSSINSLAKENTKLDDKLRLLDRSLEGKNKELSDIGHELMRKNSQIAELERFIKEQAERAEEDIKWLQQELLEKKRNYESCILAKKEAQQDLKVQIENLKEREADRQSDIYTAIELRNLLTIRDNSIESLGEKNKTLLQKIKYLEDCISSMNHKITPHYPYGFPYINTLETQSLKLKFGKTKARNAFYISKIYDLKRKLALFKHSSIISSSKIT